MASPLAQAVVQAVAQAVVQAVALAIVAVHRELGKLAWRHGWSWALVLVLAMVLIGRRRQWWPQRHPELLACRLEAH